MGRKLAICALVGALAATAAVGTYMREHPSARENVEAGDYQFNMVQYVVNKGSTVELSEFGKLVSSQPGNMDLNVGGTEKGLWNLYDFSGNGYPDATVILRANGDIASIGLDYGSVNYETLKDKLGDRVTLFEPPQPIKVKK